MKKKITKIVTVLIFVTIGWFIARSVYKYCATTAFWVGFLSCFIGIIITCGIFVSIRTATVQLGVNRFFMDLQTMRRHQNVINKNKAGIIFLILSLASCRNTHKEKPFCDVSTWGLGYWQAIKSNDNKTPYDIVNKNYMWDSVEYIKEFCK